MECIKKLHDKLDQVDKVSLKLVKFVNLVMQIFTSSVVWHIMPLPTLFFASEFYSDISILVSRVYASCIYAANMLPPVRDKLIIR